MSRYPLILMTAVFPMLCGAQESSALVERAKQVFFERTFAQNSAKIVDRLRTRGASGEELEKAVYSALDSFADCVVDEIHAQAVEQGLPVEDILKVLGGGAADAEKIASVRQLDKAAMNEKMDRCQRGLLENLKMESVNRFGQRPNPKNLAFKEGLIYS